jgi:hypothetical protein
MSGVRPFVKETDMPQVADLHRLVFGRGQRASPGQLDPHQEYLGEVFLNNPWRDDALPSLVYEDDDDRIIGFLGVMPRPMVMNGRRLRVAISSQFMVHPQRRGRVGLQLVRAFFSGAQDLSITEGGDLLRTIWEGLGGTTLLLYSVRWTRPLRPGRYVLSFLKRHGTASMVALAVTPLCIAVEKTLGQLGQRPFHPPAPDTAGEELTENALLAGLTEVARCRSLRPQYDERSAQWLFTALTNKKDRGRFRKVLVRDTAGAAAGWYLYYLKPAAISEVVQVAARDGAMSTVLGHLFHDAWTQGAVAVSGQLDPGFIPAFSDGRCLMHGGGGSWILAHSRWPELLAPIQRGDAFLTRLEGEWWVGF